MKIAHIITTIDRGGAENHLADLIDLQIRAGHSVCVAYLKGTPYWKERLERCGARVADLGMRGYGDLMPFFRLRSLLGDFSPDLVHAHMPPAETYARMALLGIPRARLPLVISKHNDEPFFKGKGEGWLASWTARRAERMIAISGAVKRYMRERDIIHDTFIESIHYGIDPKPFQTARGSREEVRASWNLGRDEYVIGTVARLVPQKALHVLLDAFARHLAATRRPAKLALVGRGPLEDELKARAQALGLEGKVVWAGFREDIPAVMQAFDVFALTSQYEGFGLVLLEAMAAGKPVAATRVSAIPEVVQDGRTGILFEAGAADQLAAALGVLEDEGVRARYGEEGLRRVLESFTLERMLERTLSVYHEALAAGRPAMETPARPPAMSNLAAIAAQTES